MGQRFPEVQGGGSLMLAWQVRNRNVLVVGGGEVSPLMLCAIRYVGADADSVI